MVKAVYRERISCCALIAFDLPLMIGSQHAAKLLPEPQGHRFVMIRLMKCSIVIMVWEAVFQIPLYI